MSAITWDPQIRGAAIFILAVLILPGSVYLLLATNTGAKLGFVLAATGLAGWVFVMAVIWMVYGIGLRGRDKHWKVEEVVPGDVRNATLDDAQGFPQNWIALPPGDAVRADAQAAADTFLAPSAETAGEHGGGGGGEEAETPGFTSPFRETGDYVVVGVFHRWATDNGRDNELFTIGKHKFYFRHAPHYAVVRVQPVLEQVEDPGVPPPIPVADPAQEVINLLMVRDLGSLRFPPFVVAIASFLVFAVCCYWLHQRDKQIWAAQSAAGEPVPAT